MNRKTEYKLLTMPEGYFRIGTQKKEVTRPSDLECMPIDRVEQLGPNQIEVKVRAVGLTFRDVLGALWLYPGEAGPLGVDGAGQVSRVGSKVQGLKIGDRVFGIMLGCLASYVVVDYRAVALIPPELNEAQAAAIPSNFFTAYVALCELAHLKANQSVLIHAG